MRGGMQSEMNANLEHLFVYGSLMTRLAHPMGERLRAEATLVGPATFNGRLYRISWYPGVLDSADSQDVVHGEVYRLSDPEYALTWLDEYEGIHVGQSSVAAPDEYRRVVRDVMLEDGTRLTTQIYLYSRLVDSRARVVSGRWVGPVEPMVT
jgi:gamma-glutamylcyclotransferase (GGCT)/AIG2-like uncharacterized protein YtfP